MSPRFNNLRHEHARKLDGFACWIVQVIWLLAIIAVIMIMVELFRPSRTPAQESNVNLSTADQSAG